MAMVELDGGLKFDASIGRGPRVVPSVPADEARRMLDDAHASYLREREILFSKIPPVDSVQLAKDAGARVVDRQHLLGPIPKPNNIQNNI